jgi:heme-degrading monooxygenase HmoA
MYALIVVFTLPEGTDWEAMRQTARERAALYAEVPGLRSKAFVLAPERRQYGGHYVWETREALNAFLTSDLFASSKVKFGEPELAIFEVAAYLSEGMIVSGR